MIKEACVETLSQAKHAERLGANRIELCSRLDLDGLTPSIALFRQVRQAMSIPIHVMIRTLPVKYNDDFVLTEEQVRLMEQQMIDFTKLGADGFVLGALDTKGMVAIHQIQRLQEGIGDKMLVFHKAIDLCPDPLAAALDLEVQTNVTHILSSGGASSAAKGVEVLETLISQLYRIKVIVAGGVTDQNLAKLHHRLSATEYHGKKIVGDLEAQ